MANKKISELPYINGGKISGNTLVPLVTYFSAATGDTVHTYIDDFQTYLISGLTGNTDVFVTGGTYSAGTSTFTNNTGGTFTVTGFYTGETSYVNSLTTGVGLSADTTTGDITIINTDPDQVVTLNNGTNINVTGTYPNFTIDVTGLTDFNTFTTGFTYSSNTFTISDNSGSTFDATFTEVTGLTVNGDLNITGTVYSNIISATTYQNLPDNVTGNYLPLSGGTVSGNTIFTSGLTGITLDISGKTTTTNLQVTSGASAGYVLTAIDSSGNTRWESLGSDSNELDPVLTITGTTPGSAVTIGDRYLISGGTGIWSGRDNQIAEYTGSGLSDYSYYIPVLDDVVYVTDTLTTYRFNGSNWVAWRGVAILQNGNSLTTSVNIGSNNNRNLTLKTNNQTRVNIDTSGTTNIIGKTNLVQAQGLDFLTFSSSTLANSGQTMYIRQTASSQYIFGSQGPGIGIFMRVGPTNVVNFEGQTIQSLSRGAQFGASFSNPVQIPYAINISTLPSQSTGTTSNVDAIRINPSITTTNTYTGTYRGIYYNPTVSITTGTTHLAIETVRGDVLFGTTSGNVGIGTTSPSEKLDVSGKTKTINLQITSGATAGYVLTSDASGNASWQASTGGSTFTGGTVTGSTNFTNGLSANTISATTLTVNGVNITGDTYVTGLTFNTSNYNLTIGRNDGVSFTDSLAILASDLTVTGGTYNPNNGTATFTNNTGGTFNVTGFLTGFTDTFVTGGTYSAGAITFTNTSGGTFNVTGFYTGDTTTITGATSVGTGVTIFDSVVDRNIQINSITGDTLEKITTSLSANTIQVGINEQNLTLWPLVVNGNRLIDGSVSYVSGLTFDISPLNYIIDGSLYNIPSSSQVTLNSGDSAFDRIDVIFADISGNTGVLEGTPSANPEKPIVDSETQVEVTFVSVPANSTTPTISTELIYDEFTGEPTEWNFLKFGNQTFRISGDSTAQSYSGSKSISVSGLTTSGGSWSNGFVLSATTLTDTNQFATLQFAIRNMSGNSNNTQIRIRFLNQIGSPISSPVYLWGSSTTGQYVNYSASNTSSWQLISIPLWKFYLTNTNVYGVRFDYAVGSTVARHYFDKIELVEGTASSPPSNSWTTIKGDGTTTITAPNPNATLTISGGTNIGSFISGTSTVVLNLDNNINLSGVTASTISATTYQNLPTDVRVTGGTYSAGTITFTNNTGGTFNVTGLTTGSTSTVSGDYLPLSGGTVTGGTIFQSGLTANTISADTLTVTNNISSTNRQLYATDLTPTVDWENVQLVGLGGTSSIDWGQRLMYDTGPNLKIDWQNSILYDGGTITSIDWSNRVLRDGFSGLSMSWELRRIFDSSGLSSISYGDRRLIKSNSFTAFDWENGILTGQTNIQSSTISATTYQNLPVTADTFTTAFTYSNNVFTISRNQGQPNLTATIDTVTGLTVNGNLTVTGNTNVRSFTGTTGYISGSGQNILTVIGSGNSTTSPLFSVQGSSGELFSVSDSLVGSLFSVNDISGLPILETFSDNTTLWGSYQAPSLNTTTRTSLTAGTNTIYSIPTSAYTGAFYEYTLISSGATGARAGQIMSIWSGTTANFTETTTTDIGTTTGVTFTVAVSGNNAVLSSSATTAGWTVKTIIRSI